MVSICRRCSSLLSSGARRQLKRLGRHRHGPGLAGAAADEAVHVHEHSTLDARHLGQLLVPEAQPRLRQRQAEGERVLRFRHRLNAAATAAVNTNSRWRKDAKWYNIKLNRRNSKNTRGGRSVASSSIVLPLYRQKILEIPLLYAVYYVLYQ